MEAIYSKSDAGVLLHIVHRLADARGRTNIVPNEEFLQVACMRMGKGQTFKAHRHIEADRVTRIPQESWLVVKGSVQCFLYDLDNTVIAKPVLGPGDCSITLRGGHNYLILEEDTIVYEYKTGPYLGIELDKTFI
ncbi:MAG TPA: hypothetical protein VJL28_15185 [Gemmatimonadaceae bacterium]|nr:hypothetical protein [Gemmatimonadaceae bacterium]